MTIGYYGKLQKYKCYFYSHEPGTILKSMSNPQITDLYVTNPSRYITEIVPEMNKKNVLPSPIK